MAPLTGTAANGTHDSQTVPSNIIDNDFQFILWVLALPPILVPEIRRCLVEIAYVKSSPSILLQLD